MNGGTVILHLGDGAVGDDDLIANGSITDVGGPGVRIAAGAASSGGGPTPGP